MLLASAQSADHSGDIGLMVACIFFLAGAALLAAVPIAIARNRNHRFAEAMTAGGILWAALSAGGAILTLLAQNKYAAEHLAQINSGYFDPKDNSAQPPYPWLIWLALLAAYILLLTLAATGKKNELPPEPQQ